MNDEYRAVLGKVRAFTEAVESRQREHMRCRAGCHGCCEVWLAPSRVEADALREAVDALPAGMRRSIAARGRLELAREARGERGPRCALLDERGCCTAYDARPLVCRTQGHALRYPHSVLPAKFVRRREPAGEVAACELNFTRQLPDPGDTLDAHRVDVLLAVVNARYCADRGGDPQARYSISQIAAECDVLPSPGDEDESSLTGSARKDDPRGRQ